MQNRKSKSRQLTQKNAVFNALVDSSVDILQFYKSFVIDNQYYTGQISISESL